MERWQISDPKTKKNNPTSTDLLFFQYIMPKLETYTDKTKQNKETLHQMMAMAMIAFIIHTDTGLKTLIHNLKKKNWKREGEELSSWEKSKSTNQCTENEIIVKWQAGKQKQLSSKRKEIKTWETKKQGKAYDQEMEKVMFC